MALVAEEAAAAAWPGFVLLHYCQTFHWVSINRNHGTIKSLMVPLFTSYIVKRKEKKKNQHKIPNFLEANVSCNVYARCVFAKKSTVKKNEVNIK